MARWLRLKPEIDQSTIVKLEAVLEMVSSRRVVNSMDLIVLG